MVRQPDSVLIARAIKGGQEQARAVLKLRRAALRKRVAALRQAPGPRRAAVQPQALARLVRAAGGAGGRGTLVAEGDSWFDYPGTDVLGMLADEHGYDIEVVAHKGDRVESMAYDGGQLVDFTRRIEKVIRKGITPAAILLSGGGNDIAGDEFEMLLDHKQSPTPGLNARVVEGILKQRVFFAYTWIISAVTLICEQTLGQPVRIIVHGYDHPVPDGRGYWGGWWVLPGPWLEPGFRLKGYTDMKERIKLAGELMNQFNDVIASLPKVSGFSHVRYVNLRGTLTTGPGYKKLWDNELHPTKVGFARIAQRIAAAI